MTNSTVTLRLNPAMPPPPEDVFVVVFFATPTAAGIDWTKGSWESSRSRFEDTGGFAIKKVLYWAEVPAEDLR